MTMNGTVNTAILAACRAVAPAGGRALGRGRGAPPGASAARPSRWTWDEGPVTVDYGEVGDVVSVDRSVLDSLLDAGLRAGREPARRPTTTGRCSTSTPTRSPRRSRARSTPRSSSSSPRRRGSSRTGTTPHSLISYTDLDGLAAIEARGVLDGGMLPKVNAAREALYGGVRRVHIVGFRQRLSLLVEVFTNEGAGTLIVKDVAELPPAEQGRATRGGSGRPRSERRGAPRAPPRDRRDSVAVGPGGAARLYLERSPRRAGIRTQRFGNNVFAVAGRDASCA